MDIFDGILKELKSKIDSNQAVHRAIAESIFTSTGVRIEPSTITIKKGTAVLAVPPTLKMAIRLKEKEIIASLQAQSIDIYTMV